MGLISRIRQRRAARRNTTTNTSSVTIGGGGLMTVGSPITTSSGTSVSSTTTSSGGSSSSGTNYGGSSSVGTPSPTETTTKTTSVSPVTTTRDSVNTIKVNKRGGVTYGNTTYYGRSVVPGSRGKTASQIQKETFIAASRQYNTPTYSVKRGTYEATIPVQRDTKVTEVKRQVSPTPSPQTVVSIPKGTVTPTPQPKGFWDKTRAKISQSRNKLIAQQARSQSNPIAIGAKRLGLAAGSVALESAYSVTNPVKAGYNIGYGVTKLSRDKLARSEFKSSIKSSLESEPTYALGTTIGYIALPYAAGRAGTALGKLTSRVKVPDSFVAISSKTGARTQTARILFRKRTGEIGVARADSISLGKSGDLAVTDVSGRFGRVGLDFPRLKLRARNVRDFATRELSASKKVNLELEYPIREGVKVTQEVPGKARYSVGRGKSLIRQGNKLTASDFIGAGFDVTKKRITNSISSVGSRGEITRVRGLTLSVGKGKFIDATGGSRVLQIKNQLSSKGISRAIGSLKTEVRTPSSLKTSTKIISPTVGAGLISKLKPRVEEKVTISEPPRTQISLEPTKPVSDTIVTQEVVSFSKQKQQEPQINLLKSSQGSRNKQRVIQEEKIVQTSKTNNIQQPRVIEEQKSIQKPKLIQELRLIQQQKTNQVSNLIQPSGISKTPSIKSPKVGVPKPKTRPVLKNLLSRTRDNGFEAVGFRFGKEVSLGFGSKEKVKKSLVKFLSSTLGASGYLKSSGKKIKSSDTGLLLSKSFRKSKRDPFLVVEKKERRLKKKGGEVKEIQLFKKGSIPKNLFGI